MMRTLLMGLAALGVAVGSWAATFEAYDLRVEYRVNPLGLDTTAPRLMWKLRADAPKVAPGSMELLVADSPEALAQDQGNLWAPAPLSIDALPFVAYAGKKLGARAQAWWKVRVQNEAGEPGPWSAPAHFSLGLLAPEDWQAQWIGYDAPWGGEDAGAVDVPMLVQGARWIWAEVPAGAAADKGKRFFRGHFALPEGARVHEAHLALTADNACSAWVNGVELSPLTGPMTSFNVLYRVAVTDLLQPGDNVIAVEAENDGDDPNPAGMLAVLDATLADGTVVRVTSDGNWKAFERPRKEWQTLAFDDSDWAAAQPGPEAGADPWGMPRLRPPLILPPPPYLRRAFDLKPEVTRATLYATALGLYEMQINGQRVGDAVFTPGWTDYDKRVYYQTYDVTPLVQAGAPNALGAILADGWYAGYVGFRRLSGLDRERGYYEGEPRLRAQLEVEYADGSREVIASDEQWRAAYGAIREADLLMGEKHDTTLALSDWATPAFNDTGWAPVETGAADDPLVQAHPGTPVLTHEEIPAVSVDEPLPGVYVYNLGQNISGHVRLTVNGERGQVVTVRHAERLTEDGQLYTTALRQARAVDQYVLAGGEQTLEPHFTFHGFQYVEISGLATPPTPEQVVGVVVHSDIPRTGSFASSDVLLNQLFHNIIWGQKGNYLEIPTDCPQRDERLGWTGDAQFFMPTALYNADIGAFFTKWLVDLVQDAQFEEGYFADIAPNIGLGGGAVAWGDAAVICPYLMYRQYGDTRIIEQHFDALEKYLAWLDKTSEGYIRKKLGYGDWVNLGGGAKDEVICTAYYYYVTDLMGKMAAAIGRDRRAKHYAEQAEKIRAAFIAAFVQEDGRVLDSSQTGYALAFTMGLLPEEKKAAAAEHFAAEIARFDGHLATGFIGTPRLLPGLDAAGRQDLAYDLLMKKTFPSWLFQVTLGATTMWERWDGWTPDKGFQTPGMNSFNHYAFGAVGQYLYETVGGIRPTSTAFRTFDIAPEPGGGLTHAEVNYESIHGPIRSAWELLPSREFKLEVTVPVGTTATLRAPKGYRFLGEDGVAIEGDSLPTAHGNYTLTAVPQTR